MTYFRVIGADSPVWKFQVWAYSPGIGDVLWRYGLEGKEAQEIADRLNRTRQNWTLVRTGAGITDFELKEQ